MNEARTAVYRAFDGAGNPLYVGIAGNWARRWSQHADRSAFFPDVAKLEVEWLASRESALQREAELIRALRPRFNFRGLVVESRPRELECDRCGCRYARTRELGWTPGARCGDRTGSPDWRECGGHLRAAFDV